MPENDSPTNRATLADVLGALVTSVSRARVQADLSSIEIARLYHSHDLLRGMPVPRLRLNQVEVVIPLVVDSVRPQEPFEIADSKVAAAGLVADLSRALKNIEVLNAQTSEVLKDKDLLDSDSGAYRQLERLNACILSLHDALKCSLEGKSSFVFESRFVNALDRALQPIIEVGDDQPASELDVQEAAVKAINRVLEFKISIHVESSRKNSPDKDSDEGGFLDLFPQIRGHKEADKFLGTDGQEFVEHHYNQLIAAVPDLLAEMKRRARSRVIAKTTVVPEIEIASQTTDVKNLGNPGTITRLRMVMSEEGLEWVAEANDDKEPLWRLTPE